MYVCVYVCVCLCLYVCVCECSIFFSFHFLFFLSSQSKIEQYMYVYICIYILSIYISQSLLSLLNPHPSSLLLPLSGLPAHLTYTTCACSWRALTCTSAVLARYRQGSSRLAEGPQPTPTPSTETQQPRPSQSEESVVIYDGFFKFYYYYYYYTLSLLLHVFASLIISPRNNIHIISPSALFSPSTLLLLSRPFSYGRLLPHCCRDLLNTMVCIKEREKGYSLNTTASTKIQNWYSQFRSFCLGTVSQSHLHLCRAFGSPRFPRMQSCKVCPPDADHPLALDTVLCVTTLPLPLVHLT